MTDEREGKISASGFEKVVFCPGSAAAEKAIGNVGGNSAIAQAGTDIHAAISTEDLSELGIKEEDVAAHLIQMNQQALEDWKKDFGVDECEIIKEDRFWVVADGEKITSARVDFAAISKCGQFCFLLDNKSGFREVTRASSNWQLKVGLVALNQKASGGFRKARVAVAQFRLGQKFDACDYEQKDIVQSFREILFFAKRSDNPNAERVPGTWCDKCYCKARTQCPEFAGWNMMPMLRAKMLDLPKKADVEARVALLPLEALAFIESRRTVATNLFKAVSDRLKGLPADALAALGYELKASGGTGSIPDLGALWAILERNKLCTGEEFRAMCDISIGALKEKLVPRIKLVQELPSNKAAEDVLKALIEPVVVKGLPSQTLKKK